MRKETRPLKRIVKREFYVANSTPRSGGSYILILECGHQVYCKASQRPAMHARCGSCPQRS